MIKHFSHNDLDGYSCVLLAQLAYGPNEVSFDNCSYEDINEKVSLYITNKDYLNYEHCYITDISITKDLAETIQSLIDTTDSDLSASHFQLIDHHLSATALEVFLGVKYVFKMKQVLNVVVLLYFLTILKHMHQVSYF